MTMPPPLRRPLILASGSPRRHDLLGHLGIPFEVLVPSVDETLGSGPIEAAVAALAVRKARAVAERRAVGTILAGDTVVEVEGLVLGKPIDAEDARRMLGLLSGSSHRVHSGVAVIDAGSGLERSGTATTRLSMRPLTAEEIDDYVSSGEPFGKAGAYAVQETADRFVVQMDGDFDTVVGLPLRLVRALLRELARGLQAAR